MEHWRWMNEDDLEREYNKLTEWDEAVIDEFVDKILNGYFDREIKKENGKQEG